MTARLKPHPAAEILPMLSEPELAALQEKFVAAREQLVPAVLLEGKILDGRNRAEICRRLGWTLKTITWDEWFELNKVSVVPRPSPTEWVLAMNLERRHLNESQRAIAAAKALPLLEAEAKKRMKAGGGDKRVAPRGATRFCGDTYPARGGGDAQCTMEMGHAGPHRYNQPVLTRQEIRRQAKPASGKAAAVAAKAAGASARSVERAKAVLEQRPDLATLIEQGKAKLGQVEKAMRKEKALKNVLEYRPPVGSYAVIVTDVAWEYDDKLDGSDLARGGVDYHTQKFDEILKMKIPAAPDCALWFWVTNAFLMDGSAARVLDAWGFRPKALLTWRKVDKSGKDRLGSGHYLRNNTEHVILAVKGKPVINGADQPTFFEAPRGGHSEKPDEFFAIAERVTPCPPEARIELYAIEKERKGWATSGSEQQAKARAGRHAPPIERAAHAGAMKALEAGASAEEATAYVDRLLDRGWEPSPTGYAKKFDGLFWCIETVNGSKKWQAYRPKQGEVRARRADDFPTSDAAMEWVESVAPGAAELPALDDGTLCGVRPSKKGDSCIHKQGHDGVHSNGRTTWRDRKGKLPAIEDVAEREASA